MQINASTTPAAANDNPPPEDLPATQLSDKIRKFGNRYYGIRLVSSNVARLPARKRQQ